MTSEQLKSAMPAITAERLENKNELDKISIAISNVISSISDLRVDIAKLTMRNEYSDKINKDDKHNK